MNIMIGGVGIEAENNNNMTFNQDDLESDSESDSESKTKTNIEQIIDFYYKIKKTLLNDYKYNNSDTNTDLNFYTSEPEKTTFEKSKPIPIPKPNENYFK